MSWWQRLAAWWAAMELEDISILDLVFISIALSMGLIVIVDLVRVWIWKGGMSPSWWKSQEQQAQRVDFHGVRWRWPIGQDTDRAGSDSGDSGGDVER